MIRLVRDLPAVQAPSAAYLRILCLFDAYRDDRDVMFWEQDGGKAYLSLAGGDLTVYDAGGDREELARFMRMLAPGSLFGSEQAVRAFAGEEAERLTVMMRQADLAGETPGDLPDSGEVYALFRAGGFVLPPYPDFAVDFCRRLNHGLADCFLWKEKCAAVTFHSGKYALLCGIVSREKGFGSRALCAAIQQNRGRAVLACCREEVTGFYEKHGFKKTDHVGCWKKQ